MKNQSKYTKRSIFACVAFLALGASGAYLDHKKTPQREPDPIQGYSLVDGALGLNGHKLRCPLSAWPTQQLYHRHRLPVVAEGCYLEGIE